MLSDTSFAAFTANISIISFMLPVGLEPPAFPPIITLQYPKKEYHDNSLEKSRNIFWI
jgi:hypothetical protein